MPMPPHLPTSDGARLAANIPPPRRRGCSGAGGLWRGRGRTWAWARHARCRTRAYRGRAPTGGRQAAAWTGR